MNEQNPVDLAALDRLADLYRDGLITREEFERAKGAVFTSSSSGEVETPAPLVEPVVPEPPAPPPSGIRRIDVSDQVAEPEIRIPAGPNKRPNKPAKSNSGRYAAIAIVAVLGLGAIVFFLVRDVFAAREPKTDPDWKPSPAVAKPANGPGNPAFDKEYDERMLRIVDIQDKFEGKMADLGLKASIAPGRMATKAGRAKSTSHIKSLAAFFEKYADDLETESASLDIWYASTAGKDLPEVVKLRASVDGVRTEFRKMFELFLKVIGYAESYRPTIENKRLSFRTDRQVNLYNTALKSIEKQSDKVIEVVKAARTHVVNLHLKISP